jgi:hypothetical protein
LNINRKWQITVDGGFRWPDDLSLKSQYIARVGVMGKLPKGIQAGGGIAFSGVYANNELAIRELRIYQEANHRVPLGQSAFIHRFRLEERFLTT